MKSGRSMGMTVILMVIMSGALAAQEARPAVHWGTNLMQGIDEAQAKGQPLVVHFYRKATADGMPMEEMIEALTSVYFEKKVFTRPEFQAYAGRAAFVKLAIDEIKPTSMAATILREYDLVDFPAVVVLDVINDELFSRGTLTGFGKADRFLRLFGKAMENQSDSKPTNDPAFPEIFDPDLDFVPPSPFDERGRLIDHSTPFFPLIDQSSIDAVLKGKR